MPLTIYLSTGEHVTYKDSEKYAVGVSFGAGTREGWLHVLRHDLVADRWDTWAFFPPGGWCGIEGEVEDGLPEAPKGIGFRGPAHNLDDRAEYLREQANLAP